jgi:ankyrin repeat protein
MEGSSGVKLWDQAAIDGVFLYRDWSDCVTNVHWQQLFHAIRHEGLPVNAQSSHHGYAAVHFAAENNLRALATLVCLGANLSLEDDSGRRPMHLCAVTDRMSDMDIINACELLPATDLAHQDKKGRTPLHLAVMMWRYELVQWMLRQTRCDPFQKDNTGIRPMQMVYWYGGSANKAVRMRQVFAVGLAERRRWSPGRATWAAAVTVAIVA